MYKILNISSYIECCTKHYHIIIKFEDSKERTDLLITKPNLKYDYLVSLIIGLKYNNDKIQAIINNYLLDSDDETSIKEFNEMQEWRKISKQLAKDILTAAN